MIGSFQTFAATIGTGKKLTDAMHGQKKESEVTCRLALWQLVTVDAPLHEKKFVRCYGPWHGAYIWPKHARTIKNIYEMLFADFLDPSSCIFSFRADLTEHRGSSSQTSNPLQRLQLRALRF